MAMVRIDELLSGMLAENGSDLHLSANHAPRIRVNGDLAPLDLPVMSPADVETYLKAVCPAYKWQQFEAHNDVDFAYEIAGTARFRCNLMRTYRGMAGVFRVIPTEIATIEALNLPPILKTIAAKRHGLIFVTGPTGSGKSTTLAAMIDHINRNFRRKIITVEDPVEFVHTNRQSVVIHREVGVHTDSFATALRSAIRSNPDILLVGELRDLETIRLALNCAAMGMLVFGTLHTNNAPKTIDRVVDAFPAAEQDHMRMLLADALEAVVSQLLCRRAVKKGRVPVHEILLRTPGLPNTIREGQTAAVRNILESGRAEGMVSMDASLMERYNNGDIDAREAYMLADHKDVFRPLLEAR